MDFILDYLAQGNHRDARNLRALRAAGITAVLNLAEDCDDSFPDDRYTYLKIPLIDGEPMPNGTIPKAVGFIRQHGLEAGGKVLVHCNAGISRSTAIILCYLYEAGYAFLDAMSLIRSKRPIVNPHSALLDSVLAYYHPK